MSNAKKKPQPPLPGLVLGIEVSTPSGGVALASPDGQLLAHDWACSHEPISKTLLPRIERLIRDDHSRVEAIAVTSGPGSFTSVRVGLSIAKTLAHQWGKPLYAFSTLAMTARRWGVAGAVSAVLLDARRHEVYLGLYRHEDSGEIREICPDEVVSVATACERLAALEDDTIWLLGNGSEVYADELRAALGERGQLAPAAQRHPAADTVALEGAHALIAGEPGVDPLQLAPMYLRVSDAEKRHRIEVPLEWSAP